VSGTASTSVLIANTATRHTWGDGRVQSDGISNKHVCGRVADCIAERDGRININLRERHQPGSRMFCDFEHVCRRRWVRKRQHRHCERLAYYTGSGSTVDSSNLVIDNANTRLGLGTTTPGARLSIAGGDILCLEANIIYASSSTSTISSAVNALSFATAGGTSIFSIDSTNGRIGIGTSTPGTTFAVQGQPTFQGI